MDPQKPSATQLAPPESLRLPILLRRSWYGLNQAFRRRIVHTRCTPDQYTVLRNLSEHAPRGMTQSELTRAMSSDPNTIASLLRRMERLGLVERRSDPDDRRARRVRLKLLGINKYHELQQIAIELQEEVLTVLPLQHRASFLKRLASVADACRSAADT